MSWHDYKRQLLASSPRRLTALAVLCCLGTAPLLSACAFQPLYSVQNNGTSVADTLAAVEISLIPGRVGQRLRNELLFRTTGGGAAPAPQYKLEIAVRESVRNIIVRLDGDAAGQIYALRSTFRLFKIGQTKPVLEGVSSTQAAFQKGAKAAVNASVLDDNTTKSEASIFASVRARQDAENRAARTAADEIRTRIAAFLAANS